MSTVAALYVGTSSKLELRFQKNPKVQRKKKRSSVLPVSSDTESPSLLHDDEDDESPSQESASAERGRVTEPKHQAARHSRSLTSQSMGAIGSYLKEKVEHDRLVQSEMLEVRKAKLEIDRRAAERADMEAKARQEQEEKRINLSLAKEILASEGASDELKARAEAFLMDCLKLPS